MAITLNPTLDTAQDSMDRRPIVEIISDQFADPIPFDGSYFNDSVSGEHRPASITHSSGSLCMVYSRDWYVGATSPKQHIYYMWTDAERTIFQNTLIYNAANYEVEGLSLVELANGDIGVVFQQNDPIGTTTTYLKQMTINVSGEVVSAATNIDSFSEASYWVDSPHVVNFSGENYFLSYAHCDLAAHDNSGEYRLRFRTSSDFTSWSNTGEIFISGELWDTRRRDNPFVIDPDEGNMLIFFDYVDELREDGAEVVNIYKASSTDYGQTWTSGEQLTTYTEYGYSAKKPTAAITTGGAIKLSYHDETNVLTMDDNEGGWCASSKGDAGTICGTTTAPTDLHFNPLTRKLFLQCKGDVIASLCSIIVIDVDTWTIENCYSDSSVPAYGEIFSDGHHCKAHMSKSDGNYVAVGTCASAGYLAITCLNYTAESFTEYYFRDYAAYSKTKNIDVDWRSKNPAYIYLAATQVDADTDRLYVLFRKTGYSENYYWFGYIDLTETADVITGKYTWNEINYWSVGSGWQAQTETTYFHDMLVVPSANYLIISSVVGPTWTLGVGSLYIYNLSNGAEIKNYTVNDYPWFHYCGMHYPAYYNGFLFGSFPYKDDGGQEDRKGVMRINVSTDEIIYIEPTFGDSPDDYTIKKSLSLGDGRILFATDSYGANIYNTDGTGWDEYNNETVPGFTPDGDDSLWKSDLDYDSVSKTIFANRQWAGTREWYGVLAFSEYGAYKQVQYCTGTWGTDWTFGAASDLVLGQLDYNGTISLDSEDVIWLIWTRLDGTEESLKWDKSSPSVDLTNYLIEQVTADWAIDRPNKLSFSCSYGHLFDPTNLMSILAVAMTKGRKVTLRFGELISGSEYWQNQGTFVLNEVAITYKRGDYPIINVDCEDMRLVWAEGNIIATDYYSDQYPETILDDLVQTHGNFTSAQTDLPSEGTMTNAHKIWHQWVDVTLMEMVQNIVDHFGYTAYMDENGKFTVKEIDLTKATDHVYGSMQKIVDLSPDSSFSSFTNRVIVKGEGRTPVQVVYNEDRIIRETGTAGWWGVTNEKIHYYSDDRQQKVTNPRLDIIESPRICVFFVWKGGGSINITDTASDETWVEVTVKCPDLIGELVGGILAMIATGAWALSCDIRWRCGLALMLLSVDLSFISYILGAVANYSYDIYGQPLGHEKQMFQGIADDTEFQTTMNGLVIAQELTDPLCYSESSCQTVANQELDVVKAQRNRLSFSKIAHLQDEICDIIEVPHPYSGQGLKILVSNIRRVYMKPESPGATGSFIDYIQGWKVT